MRKGNLVSCHLEVTETSFSPLILLDPGQPSIKFTFVTTNSAGLTSYTNISLSDYFYSVKNDLVCIYPISRKIMEVKPLIFSSNNANRGQQNNTVRSAVVRAVRAHF